mmetsp:Transcript_30680/g.54865  ORF Transcript_30680/g.54865 Transcript_30680/m.54865 type:complete len:211 (-) Transcript_30680:390-1022(-)
MTCIEVTQQDHWTVGSPMLCGELREACHDLRNLSHTDGRLSFVVGVLGKVRGDHHKWRRGAVAASSPLQQHHQAAPIALFPPLLVAAIHHVEAIPCRQRKLGTPPEDPAAVQGRLPRPLVENGIPLVFQALGQKWVVIQLNQGYDVSIHLPDFVHQLHLALVPLEEIVLPLHLPDLLRAQDALHEARPYILLFPIRSLRVEAFEDIFSLI